ncbi:hypothetical protein EMCRGX_G008070 [Ephydatia muelleri]
MTDFSPTSKCLTLSAGEVCNRHVISKHHDDACGRLLVRKNGRLRYTAKRNVGNRIMVFSTALWQKCWIPRST